MNAATRDITIAPSLPSASTREEPSAASADPDSSTRLMRLDAFVWVRIISYAAAFVSHFLIVSFRFTAERQDCEECNGNGRCVFEPSSNEMTCICNKWFTGEECSINLKGKQLVAMTHHPTTTNNQQSSFQSTFQW